MKTYSVEVEPKAEKWLLGQDLHVRRRIIAGLKRLADWPVRGKNISSLKGPFQSLYRLRIGDYRAVFAVDDKREVVSVREIGHRGNVYR